MERLFLQEKAVLEETCLALGAGWLVACLDLASCFCLVRAIKLNIIQDRASADDRPGLPIGLALARLHHGLALRVFRVTSPTPPRVALWGPQKDFFAINDWHAAIRWLVLGGPWKARSRPQKNCQSPTRRFLTKILSLLAFLCALKEACRHSCRAPVEVGL